MVKTETFYDYCKSIVDKHNTEFVNPFIDVGLSNNVDIHKSYQYLANNYSNSSVSGNTYGQSKKKNKKKPKLVDGTFVITSNFYDFVQRLNPTDKKDGPIDMVKSLIRWVFTTNLELEKYNLLYTELFSKIKYIKEEELGYISVHGNQKIKFGKFISTIIKTLSLPLDNDTLSSCIEKIVDEYKSWYESKNEIKFVVLRGEEILNGYNWDYQVKSYHSSLNNSCMNNKEYLLDLYANNESKILLLTLQKGKKIIGRSLLWKLDKPDIIYMDRIYTSDNYLQHIFIDFASKNKWSYRDFDNYKDFTIHHYSRKLDKYIITYREDVDYKVKLDVKGIRKFPYMDSFKIMNRLNGTFYTHSKNKLFLKYQIMESTYGDYSKRLKIFGIKL